MPRTKGAKAGVIGNNISQAQFENLCGIMCTFDEICAVFNVSEATLRHWCKATYNETFENVVKRYSGIGKASLRRTQMKLAEKNSAMAIFLGKQYLGQRDYVETESTENIIVNTKMEKNDNGS